MLINNRIALEESLLNNISNLKKSLNKNDGSPITDIEISQDQVKEINELTQNLEQNNPFPRPLLYGSSLLNGSWLLQYSTAREIRSYNINDEA